MNFDLSRRAAPPRRHRRRRSRKKQSPVTRLRALRQDPVGWTRAIWKQMGELGWLGILAPRVASAASAAPSSTRRSILEQLGDDAGARAAPRLAGRSRAPILAAGSDGAEGPLARAPRRRRRDPRARLRRGARAASTSPTSRRAPSRRAAATGSPARSVFVLNGHAADAIVVSARTVGVGRRSRGRLARSWSTRRRPGLDGPVGQDDGRPPRRDARVRRRRGRRRPHPRRRGRRRRRARARRWTWAPPAACAEGVGHHADGAGA